MSPYLIVIFTRLTACFGLFLFFQGVALAQSSATFLSLTPDARSAAMGEAGVAASPDANAAFWNASKLSFAEKDFGAAISYTPWLRSLTNDMWLGYASVYKKIKAGQAVGLSTNYFNGGTGNYIPIQSANGQNRSFDIAVNASYAHQLGKNFSAGVTVKYIRSYIPPFFTTPPAVYGPGQTFAADGSVYYRKLYKEQFTGRERSWSFGAVLANIGGILRYGAGNQSYFAPMSLNLGGAFSFTNSGRHRFNFVVDARKSLVPTLVTRGSFANQPVLTAALKSFTDAPGGLVAELREVSLAGGAEYLYDNRLAVRGGYYNENENTGGRKFFTAGAGVRFLKNYHVDFAYLFPLRENNPLARTLRISLSMYLGKIKLT
jgi:hypothetical protein